MGGGMLLKGAGLITPYALTAVGVFRHIMKLIVSAPTAARRWMGVTAMRRIDGDKLQEFPIRANRCDKEHANEHFINGIETVLEYAEQLPTVDAEVVVRCKDCKHYDMGVCLKIYSDGNVHSVAWQKRKPEDFCSYGERKDGANAEG
nr:MAG TPA_asm: UPF0587 protein [Caudoviricetes sp.]